MKSEKVEIAGMIIPLIAMIVSFGIAIAGCIISDKSDARKEETEILKMQLEAYSADHIQQYLSEHGYKIVEDRAD